jgi:hypothetical protein
MVYYQEAEFMKPSKACRGRFSEISPLKTKRGTGSYEDNPFLFPLTLRWIIEGMAKKRSSL